MRYKHVFHISFNYYPTYIGTKKLNPLFHFFRKDKLAPKTLGLRHQGGHLEGPPEPPSGIHGRPVGGSGGITEGTPDAENRMLLELTKCQPGKAK